MSGGDPGGTTVRPLIGVGPEGPAPDYAELFPEDPPGPGARPGGTPQPQPQPQPADAPRGARRAAARSRRRLRTVVTVAAAVTGVGVLALLGHLVTGPGEADRARPAPSASQPRLALPSLLDSDGTAEPSRSAGAPSARSGAGGSSPSASGSASGAGAQTSATGSASAGAPGGNAATATAGSGAVLKPGSRGPEVVALQQRLAQVRLYDGPADGKYDGGVKDAVQRYQQSHGVTGDTSGFYGPGTRRSLESVTAAP
ncbi:peptidoglycan-binding protein [Actinacidiphila glaucinigra]|uniref:peptidoglycan-binding domain-containing protein n=1 Tax=Actinacidiphila glaucinigra TaxID=235986 RepID=UPI002DD8D753|nr:peptidoglycan-binding domain-containing protein [Actinacidiphila glaucinigra]WSD61663.1 peptidoglycan-binding protein [Actinacidiphila glaucinigra]